MPESPEHLFLKQSFLNILNNFSKLKIYDFTETERKKFDLSCLLSNDYSRPLVGQTLWKHTHGIEKDLRTLLFDSESEIKVYLAKSNIKHHCIFDEIINDYKKTEMKDYLYKLKPIWIPFDFDADNLTHQVTIKKLLEENIVNDILFNVIFGGITYNDVDKFLAFATIPGLLLVVLYSIATNGFLNYPKLSRDLGVNTTTLRTRIAPLAIIGLLDTPKNTSAYKISPKGKILLEIIRRLDYEINEFSSISNELSFILKKLSCEVHPLNLNHDMTDLLLNHQHNYWHLIQEVYSAKRKWNVDFQVIEHSSNENYNRYIPN